MKMLKEIRRRLQLAEKGEWYKLLSSHLEYYPRKTSKTRKEKDTGEGRNEHATSKMQRLEPSKAILEEHAKRW